MSAKLVFPLYHEREEDLTPRTLRGILRDEYLMNCIEWLLGQKSKKYQGEPKAMLLESSWKMANSITYCLEAISLFENKDELHRRYQQHFQEIVTDLLNQRKQVNNLVNWENQLFDTVVVLKALIKYKDTYTSYKNYHEELDVVIQKAVKWLCSSELLGGEEERRDGEGTSSICQIIDFLIFIPIDEYKYIERFSKIRGNHLLNHLVYELMDRSKEEEQKNKSKNDSSIYPEYTDIETNSTVTTTLSKLLIIFDKKKQFLKKDLKQEIKNRIPDRRKKIEKVLTTNFGNASEKTIALRTYLLATAALEEDFNSMLILYRLYNSCRS